LKAEQQDALLGFEENLLTLFVAKDVEAIAM
jgi:hypothetical protein